MKANEQYFPVVLFVMLYTVVLTFQAVQKRQWCTDLSEICSNLDPRPLLRKELKHPHGYKP